MLLGELPGFLGTRGSLMLDVVFVALFAIVPVMVWSIYLVRYRRKYDLHKKIQLTLGTVLLVAVLAFEVDLRLFTDWEALAEPSPYYAAEGWSPVWISLVIHLCFAIPTVFLWIYVMVAAFMRFPSPPQPGPYSRRHKFWGRLAAIELVMTSITGWIFYWLAFVAT